MTEENNIIDEKMMKLADYWEEFVADSEKVLSRWLFPRHDLELVNLFFRLQDEQYGDIPDLFITFKEPLVDSETYPTGLKAELNKKYEEIKPVLEEEELSTEWTAPKMKNESHLNHFISALESFQDFYKDIMRTIAVVLRPSQLSDGKQLQQFINNVVYQKPNSTVRFVVLEFDSHPVLDELAKKKEINVYTKQFDLETGGLMESLAKGDGADTPETIFRTLFVKLSNQASKGEIADAKKTASLALSIAENNNWFSMQVVVLSSLAGGLMQSGDYDDALKTYKKATKVAAQAKAEEDPAGPKMEIQTLFSQASALFAQEKYHEAAETYQVIAPRADALEEAILTMEAWRMASYCFEVQEKHDAAIENGEKAIFAGEKIKKDDRTNSTLAFVGEALIRLHEKEAEKQKNDTFGIHIKSARHYEDTHAVGNKMRELLGDDWKDIIGNALMEKGV